MSAALKHNFTAIAWILFFSAVVYFPIFLNLENLVIRIFDEGRLSISAYEMSKSNDFIVVTYKGDPEMWSVKPPLMIWLQTLCIKTLGLTELAVRLPSALAALFLCISLFLFCSRFLKKPWLGMFAAGVLVTSEGFIREHVSRTGDYDALLTFFTTLYLLSFFIYTEAEDEKKKNRFLLIFFAGITLAALTKGIAAFIFLPAVFIYMLLIKTFLPLFKKRNFYIGLLLLVIAVGGYYIGREYMTPGYLNKVAENELGGRYLITIEGHKYEDRTYFKNIIDKGMNHWYLYVLPGLALGLCMKEKRMRNFSGFILLCGVFFLCVLSNAQTQLDWYDAPVYPLMALSVAVFLWKIFDILKNAVPAFNDLKFNILPYVFVFLFFVSPYSDIISKIYFLKEFEWANERYAMSYFLKDMVQGNKMPDTQLIVHEGYDPHLLFYIYQLEEKGIAMKLVVKEELQPGDRVMA